MDEVVMIKATGAADFREAEITCSCGWETTTASLDEGGYLKAGFDHAASHMRQYHRIQNVVSKLKAGTFKPENSILYVEAASD